MSARALARPRWRRYKKDDHLAAAIQSGWQLCAGLQTRKNHPRQTGRSPTHSSHKSRRRRAPPAGLMTVQVDSSV